MIRAYAPAHQPWGNMGALAPQRGGMMLLMRIDRWDARREGPLTEPALRQKLHALGYDASSRASAAGGVGGIQIDGRERVQAVLAGLVRVTVDGEAAILAPGDIAFVPRGAVCRVEAVGSAPALCVEAGCR